MNPNDSMHTVLGQEHSSEEFLLSSAITVTMISKVPLSKTIICTYRHLLRGRCLTGKKCQSQNVWTHGNRQLQDIFCIVKLKN